MKFLRWALVIISSGLLCACVSSKLAIKPSGAASATTVAAITAPELPCAEVKQRFVNDAVTVLYAAPSLYPSGAVLPKMEGLVCLDGLVDWLSGRQQIAWKVSVGGETGASFDPQALANKRQELLQRYFLRKGIDTSGWTWLAAPGRVNGREVQLQLKSLP
ncbi:MAG: hypothetical protein RQ754_16585 [Desulfuromonadales bacterium]|nr:hypothetical protein [Desulfuromonadales bacterium]